MLSQISPRNLINLNKNDVTMNIEIMPFHAGHITDCATLYCETYSAEPWNEQWDSEQPILDFLNAHLANNYFMGFVVQIENKLIAASIGFKKPWNQGIEYYIDEFFIHPDYQGLKVGSRLMQYIEKQCKNKQLNAIILNTERGYPSELFYKNNQFTEHEGLIIMSKSIE